MASRPVQGRAWLWAPPLAYMLLIFYLSSQSDPMPVLTETRVGQGRCTPSNTRCSALLFCRAFVGEGLAAARSAAPPRSPRRACTARATNGISCSRLADRRTSTTGSPTRSAALTRRRRRLSRRRAQYGFTSAASTSTLTACPIRSTDRTRRAFGASFRTSRPIDALQRTVHHLHHHPFVNHRAGVVLQLAADEQADAVQLVVGNRRRLAVERDDVDDAGALQDRQRVGDVESREAVAGKQRPVDLLLAILPAAPARDRRQKRLDLLAFELLADDLLVARAGPDGVPAGSDPESAVSG